MRSEDLIALIIPITFLAMIAIEYWLSTGRDWPAIPWWRTQGASFFVMMMSINAVLPSWVPQKIASHHLFEASRLGFAGSVVLGYLSLSLATATLHRAYHRFPVLWRFVHQLHHAPQRLDVWGRVVFTPLEVINNVLISLRGHGVRLGSGSGGCGAHGLCRGLLRHVPAFQCPHTGLAGLPDSAPGIA
jgi:sterol desaturase/sphingolipid hydroxylase (fatty acid hydroxylase superfamily)